MINALKGRAPVAVLAAVAATALATAASSGAAPGAAAHMHLQIEDPVGDVAAAPDLGVIDVGNDVVKGPIVMWIETPNRESLGTGDILSIFLDTDQNPATGAGALGIDYVVGYFGGSGRLYHWDGTTLARAPAPSLITKQFQKEIRIEIQPADLGGTAGFDFFIAASAGDETDYAPDGGPAAYTLRSGPVVLSVEEFTVKPKVARAGGRVTAVLLPGREDIFEVLWEGDIGCTAKVGAARVSVRKGWSDSGAACSFAVPRKAKGKRVSVTLSVTFGGQTVSRTCRSVVR